MSNKRTITQRGEPAILDEDAAAAAITPGHLVMFDGSGTLVKNTANAANVAFLVALERNEMGNDIDDDYAIGDQVKVGVFDADDEALVILPSGQNVAKGDYLTGDNAGRFTKTGVTSALRIAQACEAVDNSAGPGDARIRVRPV